MARPLNALIVEDDFPMRKLITTFLKQTGLADFSFTEADDGVDALSKYDSEATEILFVDMNMPRLDGLGFIRELRKKHKKLPPIVMITAESSKDRLMEAISESGIDALLLKPVDRDRLRTGLKKLVDSIPERSGSCVVPHADCVPRAFQEILAEACDLDLTIDRDGEVTETGKTILAMVVIDGGVHWAVFLGCTGDVATAIASRFAGASVDSDDLDVVDAIAEMANIVGARIKTLLSAKGIEAVVSLPSVFGATDFQILLQHKSASHKICFDSPVGKLWTVVTVGRRPGIVL